MDRAKEQLKFRRVIIKLRNSMFLVGMRGITLVAALTFVLSGAVNQAKIHL